jgi:hypothetical protein
MLTDRREFPRQITDMSPGGMALIAPVRGQVGERIIAYADHIGRLEGAITRQFPNGFAMTFASTAHKRDKLAAQLTWLANRHLLDLPEQRRDHRVAPHDTVTRLTLPNGLNIACHLMQISQSSATIATNQRPKIGAIVTIGTTPGRVVRHFDEGFALEFTRLRHLGFLEENVTVI